MDVPVPLTGEAKKEYQRIYMRGKRNKTIQRAAAVVGRALVPRAGAPYKLTHEEDDIAKAALALALRSNNITVDRIAGKLSEKLEAKRSQTVAGVATISDDNDAQLRATELAIRLTERTGAMPLAAEGRNGGASITVNVLMLAEEGESPTTGETIISAEIVSSEDSSS